MNGRSNKPTNTSTKLHDFVIYSQLNQFKHPMYFSNYVFEQRGDIEETMNKVVLKQSHSNSNRYQPQNTESNLDTNPKNKSYTGRGPSTGTITVFY
jgi:hypothetical protein